MNDHRRVHIETFPPRRRMRRLCHQLHALRPTWLELLFLLLGAGMALAALHWRL